MKLQVIDLEGYFFTCSITQETRDDIAVINRRTFRSTNGGALVENMVPFVGNNLTIQGKFIRPEMTEEYNIDTFHPNDPNGAFQTFQRQKLCFFKRDFLCGTVQERILVTYSCNWNFNELLQLQGFFFRNVKGFGNSVNKFLFLLLNLVICVDEFENPDQHDHFLTLCQLFIDLRTNA